MRDPWLWVFLAFFGVLVVAFIAQQITARRDRRKWQRQEELRKAENALQAEAVKAGICQPEPPSPILETRSFAQFEEVWDDYYKANTARDASLNICQQHYETLKQLLAPFKQRHVRISHVYFRLLATDEKLPQLPGGLLGILVHHNQLVDEEGRNLAIEFTADSQFDEVVELVPELQVRPHPEIDQAILTWILDGVAAEQAEANVKRATKAVYEYSLTTVGMYVRMKKVAKLGSNIRGRGELVSETGLLEVCGRIVKVIEQPGKAEPVVIEMVSLDNGKTLQVVPRLFTQIDIVTRYGYQPVDGQPELQDAK